MKLERLNTTHLPMLRTILREAFSSETPWLRRWDDRNLHKSISKSQYFGLFFGNRLIGVAAIRDDGDFDYLHSFAIIPEFRGNGIGRMMLAEILKGHSTLVLNIKPGQPLIHWYKRFGFYTYARRPNDDWMVRYVL